MTNIRREADTGSDALTPNALHARFPARRGPTGAVPRDRVTRHDDPASRGTATMRDGPRTGPSVRTPVNARCKATTDSWLRGSISDSVKIPAQCCS